jgi:hypothetical protein
MTLFENIEHIRKTWALFLPAVPSPDEQMLGYWAADYTVEEIDYAVSRTGRKRHNDSTMDAHASHAYCAGVLKNERNAPQRVQR